MKEFKGTKSRWKISPVNEISVVDDSDDYFNELICQTNGKSGSERIANAKLIAAAPDLLRALQGVKETIEGSDHWWIDSPERGGFDLDEIEKVISKALD